jgi:hypothetical protein
LPPPDRFPNAPDPALFGDYELLEVGGQSTKRSESMESVAWLLTGGFAKGYRTQILGVLAALSALAAYAVGDMGFVDLVQKLPIILGGLGLTALGVKVNEK